MQAGWIVIVDNKAGAGGSVGMTELARATPDGYTLGMASVSTMGTNPVVYKGLKYDPLKDIAAITNVASVPGLIAVNTEKFPGKDYKSFIAELKANPGKYSYASSGAGGVGHMAMALFEVMAGVDVQHIPYKGAGPALNDVVGGQVPIIWDNLTSSVPHLKSGRLTPIGLAYPKRVAQFPNLPTFAELGLPQYEAETWYGLVAPAATPKDIIAKVYQEVVKALKDPDFIKKLEEQTAYPVGNTPEQFAAQIKAELDKWRKIATEKKISLESN
jgi:tripartite-type tricarboxylate transporter receptor subunit TctC